MIDVTAVSIRVQWIRGFNGGLKQTFTIRVTEKNIGAPEFDLVADAKVDENQTKAITIHAVDPDGDTVRYSIIEERDHGNKFKINENTGEVTFKEKPDYDNGGLKRYKFTARVDDGDVRHYVDKVFFINIKNKNDIRWI